MFLECEVFQNEINRIIKPKGTPVGIKFLKNESELKKLNLRASTEERALCQVLKLAGIYEKTRVVNSKNLSSCVIGSYVLGMDKIPKDLKKRWIEGYLYDSKIFDKMIKNIISVKKKNEFVVFAPLKEYDVLKTKPDQILLFVNSSQAYLLLSGFFDATGIKTNSSFNGHAACEIIAAIENGSSSFLTIPCGGARSIADSQDDELWIGFKYNKLIEGIDRLKKVGFKYPPAVIQMSTTNLNQKHPLTGLIKK
jgi:uncharacterized protein (DUF169 family)